MTRLAALLGGACVLVGLGSIPAIAQVSSAIVEVLVLDGAKRPLVGVTVKVIGTESGSAVDAVTDDDGTARFAAIQPGTYDVHFERTGWMPTVEKDLVLRVGQTVVLHATMTARLAENVVVVGMPKVVDVRRTDSSTNIIPEQIENLPIADRDFQRLAFISPTVQRERGEFRFISGGPVIGAGGNASQSTILVDGVDLTDPALGLATTRFSQEAIREFRLISNRFDAEVGGSASGALSVVTRSGTNAWKGRAFGFLRDDSLRARGALEQDKLPYSRQQFGAAIGGPIVPNRTHMFGSVERSSEKNITLFRPGGAFQSSSADVAVPTGQTLVFGRLDHQVRQNQRLAAKFSFERFRQANFRVGGTQDISYGQELNRDNWGGNVEHTTVVGGSSVNVLHVQLTRRQYYEPRNSTSVAEWFSSGNTFRTGGNILGDLLGKGTFIEVHDSYLMQRKAHFLRVGFDVEHIRDRSRIEFYLSGLFIYVTDTRATPLAYAYGDGSGDVVATTVRYAGYAQDDWTLSPNVKLKLGLRYDLDTKGNNPDFRHPLVPAGRSVDRNNLQPRVAFSWDLGGTGRRVLRGGVGLFTGRYLLTPMFQELQQNGVTGRIVQTRINGALFGLPALALDPANPRTTGIAQKPDISVMAESLVAPQATQVSGGYTIQLGSRGLYVDTEGVWIQGRDEIIIRDTNFGGNSNPTRPNTSFNQVNSYTNDGRSQYKALIVSLNGDIAGKHLITASYTLASKNNIADDFSPELPFGFPNDPSKIGDEYGRARTDERHRLVMSGIFALRFETTVAAIYEHGSGQPWTHRLGYDFNGDGRNSDRPAGVGRFTENGPAFDQLSIRLIKAVRLARGRVDLIAEVFNVFNRRNDSAASIDGAEFLSGPTLSNPGAAFVTNPKFGIASATLPGREAQLGLRWIF